MKITTNAAATPTEIRGMYMGGAHHEAGGLSRKCYTQCVGQRTTTNGTGVSQGTPEGTCTDEGKEGSAKARTERLAETRHWRGCKHQHARCQATRERSKSARTGDEGGVSAGTHHTAAFGCGG
jgi:hypothetical protein